VTTGTESKDRHVSDSLPGLGPIFCNTKGARGFVVKKVIDVAGDQNVKIEMKDVPLNILQRVLKDKHPSEGMLTHNFWQSEGRHPLYLNSRIDACRIVREADEA
jgi:hypothetical protein